MAGGVAGEDAQGVVGGEGADCGETLGACAADDEDCFGGWTWSVWRRGRL